MRGRIGAFCERFTNQFTKPPPSTLLPVFTGEFDWNSENPDAIKRTEVASTPEFARHVATIGALGHSRRQLIGLYWEWIEANELKPIEGWGRWDRSIKAAGFYRKRSNLPGRPWHYYAPTPGTTIVLKMQTRAVATVTDTRRAAA